MISTSLWDPLVRQGPRIHSHGRYGGWTPKLSAVRRREDLARIAAAELHALIAAVWLDRSFN
jgi:hypothetical protein